MDEATRPSTEVATDDGFERVFSPRTFGAYLTLFMAISIFGAANPNMLSSPRAFYAMGQDGSGAQSALTRVSPRWKHAGCVDLDPGRWSGCVLVLDDEALRRRHQRSSCSPLSCSTR